MEYKNIQPPPPEIDKVNKYIIGSMTILVAAVGFGFIFLNDENGSYEPLLKYFLNLYINNPDTVNTIIDYFMTVIAVVSISCFGLTFYFMNKKEDLKKKYHLKDGDKTDIDIGNIAKNIFKKE